MPVSNRQPKWDIWEAAILLDGYLESLKEESRASVIKRVSSDLRAMAKNRGIEIDQIYRNVNGISFQMASMESAYQGYTVMKPATRLFTEVVSLYRNDTARYYQLLKEAKSMAGAQQDNEAMFMEWLSKRVSGAQLSELYLAFQEIAQQAKKAKIIRTSLYEKLDPKSVKKIKAGIESSRIFKLTHKWQWGRITSALNYLLQYANQQTVEAKEVESTQPTVRVNETEQIIESASVESSDAISEKTVTSTEVTLMEQKEETEQSTKVDTVNFRRIEPMAFSKPISLSYFKDLRPETSWKNLYVDACKFLQDDYPDVFVQLKEESIHGSGKTWLVDEEHLRLLAAPKKLTEDLFVETNRSASDLVKNLKWILDECAVDYENVVITYTGKDEKKKAPVTISTMTAASPQKRYYRKDKEEFYRWLQDDQHMAEGTCRSYVSAIRGAERFAEEHGLTSCKLYASDPSVATTTADELFTNLEFTQYNNEQHNRFRAAITKLLAFYGVNWSPLGRTDRALESRTMKQPVESADLTSYTTISNNTEVKPIDNRWQVILQEFPDGYPLDDILAQFQAGGYWQQHYGEDCLLTGSAIDEAMKAIGIVRDNRVYQKSEEDQKLITSIGNEVNDILQKYTCVYRAMVYQRHQEELASIGIYTEEVMTEQILKQAVHRFTAYYNMFVSYGRTASVQQDCRTVLRANGGAMQVSDVAKELWFIAYDMVYHSLSTDEQALNTGETGVWMLVEHFPISREDADSIGDAIDDAFLTRNYLIQGNDLNGVLSQRVPSIMENLSGINSMGIFNILRYYLRDRFSFTGAIVSPKDAQVDFRMLFSSYVKEHSEFTLEELSAFAKEMNIVIYWDTVFESGAVRLNETQFVSREQVHFDVSAIDRVLEDCCPGDYVSLSTLTPAMLMHFPTCGYPWNEYLLFSYLFQSSTLFAVQYNSIVKKGVYGALVRKSAGLNSYDDVIVRALTEYEPWHTDQQALEFLVKQGYQARKRYGNIANVTELAKQNKHKGGGELFA